MSTKKKSDARKKAARKHNSQKKIQSKKVVALSRQRDPIRRQAQPLVTSDEAANGPFQKERPATASTRQAVIENPIKSGSGRGDPAPVAAPIRTAFEGQMQLFAMMLRWSPPAIVLQQQALVAQMISTMRYPAKLGLT